MDKHLKAAFVAMVRDAQDAFMQEFNHLPTTPKNDAQNNLFKKHGSPYTFARACGVAVGDMISIDEARAAIERYNKQWEEAK